MSQKRMTWMTGTLNGHVPVQSPFSAHPLITTVILTAVWDSVLANCSVVFSFSNLGAFE